MKWTRLYTAVALLGMVSSALAGNNHQVHYSCGSDKCCGYGQHCPQYCCKPVVCRPTCPKVCCYQRSCCKPGCCELPYNGCCAPKCCHACPPHCPQYKNCCKAVDPCCKPVDPGCAAPCCKPVDPCCRPVDPGCAAPCCKPYDPCCKPCDPGCAAPCCKPYDPCCKTCDPGCGHAPYCHDDCGPKFGYRCEPICCNDDPCEVAHWIFVSQTACYAKDRAKALDILSDRYDCRCSPEIMCAFIYGLNDADERVRLEAARSIRQQTKAHACCCSEQVICALAGALADCDKHVRKEVEKALVQCGYDVVDCHTFANNCCPSNGPYCGNNGCCHNGCCNNYGPAQGPAKMAPATAEPPKEGAANVPPPPDTKTEATPMSNSEPEAYFPSKIRTQSRTRKGLSNLFGLR